MYSKAEITLIDFHYTENSVIANEVGQNMKVDRRERSSVCIYQEPKTAAKPESSPLSTAVPPEQLRDKIGYFSAYN